MCISMRKRIWNCCFAQRFDMCVILNRINNDNLVTGLVVDPEDGLLQCRFPCTVDDGAINQKIVVAAMCNTINCFEMSYDEIIKGIAG